MVRELAEFEIEDRKSLMNSGMQVLNSSDYIPGEYTSSPFVCPFGAEGYCNGIKDEDRTGRCEVLNPVHLLNCDNYRDFLKNPDFYVIEKPIANPLSDTVSISHDEVIRMSKRPSREGEIPLEEQANEGMIDISRCSHLVQISHGMGQFGKPIRTNSNRPYH